MFGNFTGGWTTFQATGLADSSWHFVRLTTTGSSTSLYIDGTLFGTNASGGGVEDEDIVEITNRIKNGAFQIAHLRITTGGTPPTTGIPSISSMNQAAGTGGTLAFYDALDDIAGTGTKTSDGGNVTITMAAATASVDSSATDSFIDTPTNYTAASGNNGGNYCVLNPLKNQGQTLKQGNLVSNGTSGRSTGTLYASSGKFYWEFKAGSSYTMAGIESSASPQAASYSGENDQQYALYGNAGSGQLYHNGGITSFDGFVAGDIIGVALDMDGGNLYFYKNGSAMNSGNAAATGLTGAWTANCRSGSGSYNGDTVFNFGQRPFAYTPPTGYVSLCTTNLPDPTITKGSTYFDAFLYTGDATSPRDITLPLAADFLWMKKRGETGSHQLVDTVRGNNSVVHTNADIKAKNPQTEFGGGGISSLSGTTATLSSGTSNNNNLNADTITAVGWAWDGGNLATTSDTTNYDQSQTWSSMLSAETSGSVSNPTQAFDSTPGNTSSTSARTSPTSTQGGIIFTPTGGYTFSTQIRVYGGSTADECFLDFGSGYGSAISLTGGAWNTVYTGYGTLSALKVKDPIGSQASGLGGIEIDSKILIDPGIIPVGGLNSTVYNQGQTWSDQITGTNYSGYPKTQAFNNDTSNYCLAGAGEELVFTPNPSFSNATTVKIWYYMPTKETNAIKINGTGVADDVATTGSVATHTFTVSGFTSLSWSRGYYDTEDVGIARIDVDGVQLVDSNISMPSYPAFASTVRANPTAGFSIVQYVSSGSGGRIATGLNAKADIVFIKPTSSAGDWFVYTDVIDGSLDYLKLNATDAKNDSSWTNLLNFSNFITMEGSNAAINSSGVTYSAYCFTSVEGYSSFKAHTVGSGTNFVYLGFRPRLVMLKRTGAGTTTNIAYGSWAMFDTERDTYNEVDFDTILYANRSHAQGKRGDSAGSAGGSYLNIDILSNGIRFQSGAAEFSQPSDKIIVMAWAENPFSLNGGLAR